MIDDAQYICDGSYYKIGVHGKVFRHNGLEWVLSNKTASEVKAIDLRDRKPNSRKYNEKT